MRVALLRIGASAPDFQLPDQDGKPVRLSEQLDRGPVLLYFYPADFTPVCTHEACAFRELHTRLTRQDIQVIGISPQDSATHARFRLRHALPFTLLSDPARQVIRAYGCVGPLGRGVRRVTYLVAGDGRIADVAHSALRVSRHIALADRVLDHS